MQIISILAKEDIALCRIYTCLLSEVDSEDIEIPLVKYVKLLLQSLLMVSENLAMLAAKPGSLKNIS